MKLKISWGTGIVIVFAIFMAVTISTVVYLMNQDVNLVADDYYDQGIKYQQQIDKIKRTRKLDETVKINSNGSVVTISFPRELLDNEISGKLYFYCPSDVNKDFKIPLQIDKNGIQVIPVKGFAKGFWRLKLDWLMGGNEYYSEKVININ